MARSSVERDTGREPVLGEMSVLEGYGILLISYLSMPRAPGILDISTHSNTCLLDLSSGYTLRAIISPNSTSELPSLGAIATYTITALAANPPWNVMAKWVALWSGVGKVRWREDGDVEEVQADSWEDEGERRDFLEEPGWEGVEEMRVLESARERRDIVAWRREGRR